MNKIWHYSVISVFTTFTNRAEIENELLNVIIFHANEMGFDSLNCRNPDSKIPTQNFDNLASEGTRFTDANSSSGICSPRGFALFNEMYHWRQQNDVLNSSGKPFFNDSDITLPGVLNQNGYTDFETIGFLLNLGNDPVQWVNIMKNTPDVCLKWKD